MVAVVVITIGNNHTEKKAIMGSVIDTLPNQLARHQTTILVPRWTTRLFVRVVSMRNGAMLTTNIETFYGTVLDTLSYGFLKAVVSLLNDVIEQFNALA